MNLSNSSAVFDQNNGSNTTTNAPPSSSSSCLDWDGANYLAAGFGVLIILTNVINIVVFAQANMRKNSMNAYLLAKSVSDLYNGVELTFEPISNCFSCFTLFIYGYQIFVWIYRSYINSITKLTSMILESAATFDRYVFISQKCKCFKRIDHRLVILLIYLFCAIFYVYKFLIYKIHFNVDKQNLTEIRLVLNAFGVAIGHEIFNTIHGILRDGVFVIIIVILNILILVEIKRAMAKKKTISRAHSAHSSTTKMTKSKADRAEEKITIMVVLTGVAAVLSHVLRLLSYLPISSVQKFTKTPCFYAISESFYSSSFILGFFLYFFFNNVFRETFMGLFVNFRRCKSSSTSYNTTAKPTTDTKLSVSKKSGDTTV